MGGLFRVCLPQRCAAWNHPKRWEVARGDGFDPSATKWFFLQQAVTRLVPWLFTTSLGAPNSRVWRITHRDATEFRRRACRSLPEPAAVHIQSFWCHRILESPLSQKGCGTLDQVYGGLENWVFFLFPFFKFLVPSFSAWSKFILPWSPQATVSLDRLNRLEVNIPKWLATQELGCLMSYHLVI